MWGTVHQSIVIVTGWSIDSTSSHGGSTMTREFAEQYLSEAFINEWGAKDMEGRLYFEEDDAFCVPMALSEDLMALYLDFMKNPDGAPLDEASRKYWHDKTLKNAMLTFSEHIEKYKAPTEQAKE